MFKTQCRNCGAIQADSSATKTVCEVCTIDASFLQTIVVTDEETLTNNPSFDEKPLMQCRNCSEWIEVHHQTCPHCAAYTNKSLTVKNTNQKNNSFILLN